MLNDAEGQKEAPRTVRAVQGAKMSRGALNKATRGTESMFPLLVKCVCAAWPAWLGSRWLLSKGVRK